MRQEKKEIQRVYVGATLVLKTDVFMPELLPNLFMISLSGVIEGLGFRAYLKLWHRWGQWNYDQAGAQHFLQDWVDTDQPANPHILSRPSDVA